MGVWNIHQDVHPNVDERKQQNHALHHGKVLGYDGFDDQLPQAGPGEDGLGDHRAGEQDGADQPKVDER